MKRLIKKTAGKYETYKSIMNELVNNDRNSSWNEIYDDYKERYDDETEILNSSIAEAIEIIERILNEDLDLEGDKEAYDFYKEQLNRLINLQ